MRKEFFVAVDGQDDNPGTRSRPFATLERARDAVRTFKRNSGWPKGGVTVSLRGGVYTRTTTFDLSAEDSGVAGAPAVYRAFPGEVVRIMGGKIIGGFRPVKDPAILARLDPVARGRVLQTDLRRQGITDFGQLHSRGFGRPGVPAHLELFFGGKPMPLARWPNENPGVKIAAIPSDGNIGDGHGGSIGDLTRGFHYEGDRPLRWKDRDDIWIHGYWAWDWANSYERISTLDTRKRLIRTDLPHGHYGFRVGQHFHFLNLLEEIDQPGEWYLDKKTGLLYFWPPVSPATSEAMVSVLETPLVRLWDASHAILRDLILENTRGDGIAITDGTGNRVAGCTVRLTGNYGIRIAGGKDNGVTGCDIHDNGDGGVVMTGGDRTTLDSGGHFVHNCHLYRQARWSKCYAPAVLLHGVGHRVTHNLIHEHPHCAILFCGNEHRIEFNRIHHVCMETGDVGAIYTGREWTFRGNVVRHNFIHETGGVGMGSMGVYLDDCVSGIAVIGNVFYKVQRAAFIGGGRDTLIENNIFVDCKPAISIDGRGLDQNPVWKNNVQTLKDRLAETPRELFRKRYPRIADLDPYLDDERGVPPENNVVARNICAGGTWAEIYWHADPKLIEFKSNLIDDDPGFEDAERMNFEVKRNSPAFKLGFKAIPFDKIGLVKDGTRRAI